MQPPKSSTCVICGIRPATTAEHVPPRGFFKGLSGQFRTVPACNICNNGSSEDDEALRFYISAQIGKQTDGAKLLWKQDAYKSILRSAKLRSEFLSTLREVTVDGANGKAASRMTFLVQIDLYQRVFERVTRGLYFWHTSTILPASTFVRIYLLSKSPNLNDPELMALETDSIAGDAFEYKFGIDPEDIRNSIWLFCIHKSQWVQASTGLLADDTS